MNTYIGRINILLAHAKMPGIPILRPGYSSLLISVLAGGQRHVPASAAAVAIAFPQTSYILEAILRGIGSYARNHRWVFVGSPEPDSLYMSIENLRGWDGDGIIAGLASPQEVRCAHGLGIHVVNISGVLKEPGLPRVFTDFMAAGRLAAEHFLDRGFTRFAYYGLQATGLPFSGGLPEICTTFWPGKRSVTLYVPSLIAPPVVGP